MCPIYSCLCSFQLIWKNNYMVTCFGHNIRPFFVPTAWKASVITEVTLRLYLLLSVFFKCWTLSDDGDSSVEVCHHKILVQNGLYGQTKEKKWIKYQVDCLNYDPILQTKWRRELGDNFIKSSALWQVVQLYSRNVNSSHVFHNVGLYS